MLSNIELILLSLINEKPSYAYELEKQIESRNMQMWVKIGVASVYQVLERLEKKGLLVSQREKEGKMPPRKRYRITAAGQKALAEGAGRLLSGLEWHYLDLNVGLECSDLLSEAEIATCLQKRLAKVRSNLKRLRELSRTEGKNAGGNHNNGNNVTGAKFAKKKAIIQNRTAYTLYMSYKPHSSAIIRVDTEAGVTLYCGATDIGQGSDTVMAQMAAEINKKLFALAAAELGVRAEHLTAKNYRIFSRFEPKKGMDWHQAVEKYIDAQGPLVGTGYYTPPRTGGKFQGGKIGQSPTFGFSAQVTEVEVDLETGKVKVLKVTEAGDCGQAINPMSVEGQVEGSILMGMGQALYEEIKVAPDGKLLNPNLHDYKIPTMMDLPEIDSTIVESYDPTAPFGAKESGEGPIQPVIPAIANAVADAVGVRFTDLPITPEKVLRALREKEKQPG